MSADGTPEEAGGLKAFSARVYGAPGVAEACLELQDKAGADVNLLLFALWLGRDGRGALEPAAAEAKVAGWRDTVVRPLRAVRRAIERGDPLRPRVAALELEAEWRQQALLEAMAPASSGPPDEARAIANLRLYLDRLGKPAEAPGERLIAAVSVA